MKSLLEALQQGRLIELPDDTKNKTLEYLASIIEAVPDVHNTGIAEAVLARERSFNTGLGNGWALPHGRTQPDGEIICAVGWNPKGIAYEAPDHQLVHIIVMYYVPESQKNAYLKEISSLSAAIQQNPKLEIPNSFKNLDEVRNALLDLVSTAIEHSSSQAKARMIRLEAKQAQAAASEALSLRSSDWMQPVSVIISNDKIQCTLAQDEDLVKTLEGQSDIAKKFQLQKPIDCGSYRLFFRSSVNYPSNRILYEGIAIRISGN
jgi:mannitol/fructose-specific phosphotransferase system IIA component (Ntr-type)